MHLFSKAVAEQKRPHTSQAPPTSTAKTPGKLGSFLNRSRRTSTTSEVSFQSQNPHQHAPAIISGQTTGPRLGPHYRDQQETTTRVYAQQIPIRIDSTQYPSHSRDFVEATYQPPPPSRMQGSRPLPTPPQQQSANLNPSQPSSPLKDETYSNSSQPSPVREKGYNSRLSDTSPMPPRHPSYPPLPKYEAEPSFDDNISELSSRNSPASPSAALYPGPPRTPSLPAYTYNSTHPYFQRPHEEDQYQHVYPPRPHFQGINEEEQYQHVYPPAPSSADTHYTTPASAPQATSPSSSYSHSSYLPTAPIRLEFDPSTMNASDYVFPPLPITVPGRSGGMDEHEQRKSKVPKVYPAGRSVARPKGSEVLTVRVPQAVSENTSTTSVSPLSPPAQVHADHRTSPVVPHHRLHQHDSMQPSSSSLPLSVPASTSSSVPQNSQDKDRDSTSPTTTTPTPFIFPSGRSRANPKAKPKPSTADPSPTRFKGLRLLKDKSKKPDKGKQRERDKQGEDRSEMQIMSMSMRSELTSNFSGSGYLAGSTADLGVGDEVFDIRRASNSTRMTAGNAHGGEYATATTGGKSRVGSYPLNPFDAVLLGQYVFTLVLVLVDLC